MFVFFSKPILSKARSVFMATMILTPCFVKAMPVEKAQMPSELMDSRDMLWVGAEKETVQLVPADFLVVPVNVDLVSKGFSELNSGVDSHFLSYALGGNAETNVAANNERKASTNNCIDVVQKERNNSFHDRFMIGVGYAVPGVIIIFLSMYFGALQSNVRIEPRA